MSRVRFENWKVTGPSDAGIYQIEDVRGRVIASPSNWDDGAAIAHLMAAAPDLHAACIAQTRLEGHELNCPVCLGGAWCSTASGLDSYASELREAALARAEGLVLTQSDLQLPAPK